MSSLDHDRVLEERPKAPRTAARPGAETEVPKPRRTRRSSQDKAQGERSCTTRDGAPASGSTSSTASRAKAAPTAKATAAKATAAKATPAKATPAKATAKAAPAKATVKAAPAKATAKAAPAKATVKAAPAKAAPAQRTAPIEAPEPRTSVEDAPAPVEAAAAAEPAAGTRLAGARSAVRRSLRRGAAPRRRPAVLLAAAMVGALSVGLFTAANDRATASAESRSVSVAHALGLTAATHTAAPAAAADELRMVAASRAQRQAEATAAAQAQAAADQAAIEAARPKAVNPAPGTVLTTCFCMRWGTMHWGIDLAAPLGTPEYAAMDGVVVKAGPASGFGQAVYIQHANGDVTVYGHMEKILVTTGQVVHAGDEIALMGAEGEATGPHLHFEVHVGGIQGQKVDPIAWLRERGVQI